ncbi:MAG: hypothetical protein U0S50_13095 [Sphingopyxis sp.]|uniref:hypothetical protein n=1 Tax=Sphingopyxis sp. TaxID=1908224 RepID=UPI002ABB8245|nr:hypothetical protein [Sphingopyxis sp.]MDZ3832732.1 hypothetical protein [Sphingopyxis sp.]
MILSLLAAAALTSDVAAPIDVPPPPTSARTETTPPVADSDVREFAAIAGRKVAGRPVNGPLGNADKILLLTRDKAGFPTIGISSGFPTRQSLPVPPAGTLAVVRLRQISETIIPGPTADDLAFVRVNRMPLFVIGEWARPAPMWEVAWVDGTVLYRSIGEVGEIGPWRD